jgi:hypothetical protein
MEYRRASTEVVVMSAWGRGAGWFQNIEVSRQAEIIIGSRHLTVIHQILDVDEAARVIANYERRNWLAGPLIRVVLSRLLGWRYDSSESARRQAAAQLPLIAFQPLQ